MFLGEFAGRGVADVEDELAGFGCDGREFGLGAAAGVGRDLAVNEDIGDGVGCGRRFGGSRRFLGGLIHVAAYELLGDGEGLSGLEIDEERGGIGGGNEVARRLSGRGGDADGRGCERLAGFAVDEADTEGLLSGAGESSECEGGNSKCAAEVSNEHVDLLIGVSRQVSESAEF